MVQLYHSKTRLNGPDFKWHSKTGPIEDQTCLDHSKTGLVQYSDGYSTHVCQRAYTLGRFLEWKVEPKISTNFFAVLGNKQVWTIPILAQLFV